MEQLGGDLIAFLEALTGPADCIGYSLGGTVVLWVAARRPDLVTRATVAGTSTVVGRRAAAFFRDRIETVKSNFPAFADLLKEDTRQQLATAGDRLDEVAARRLKAVGTGEGYANAARAMAQLNEYPLTPLLPGIACPVHVIGGEVRPVLPAQGGGHHDGRPAPGNLSRGGAAGHLMSVDQPDAYAEAIRNALESSA